MGAEGVQLLVIDVEAISYQPQRTIVFLKNQVWIAIAIDISDDDGHRRRKCHRRKAC